MIEFRCAHPVLSAEHYYQDGEIEWRSALGEVPDWNDPQQHALVCLIHEGEGRALLLIFNAGAGPLSFVLPHSPAGSRWCLVADTSCPPPGDLHPAGREAAVDQGRSYQVAPRSSVLLLARPSG
jgi:glycogen operon protein